MSAAVKEHGPWRVAPLRVSDEEFRRLRDLVEEDAGINLTPVKKSLLEGRLGPRLRELGLRSFADYHRAVLADPAERIRMIDAICTNETRFFREPFQFEFLEHRLFPALVREASLGRRERRVRVWSAACSTGEEPFSIAMMLLAHLPPAEGWTVEVVASDLSTKVLARAREATWTSERAAQIPERYLKAFMLRGTGSKEGLVRAGPELRAIVHFERVNLIASTWPVHGSFDLVFCRNVLMYFESHTRMRVVDRLAERLVPGGHLFLGHAESLCGHRDGLVPVQPTIYRADGRS